MSPNAVTILLVDDDNVDAETVKRGLARAKIANPLVRARDGIEALDILRGTGGAAKLELPYLLLVDINMPRMDGIELIRAVRADPALTATLIFVLTTSDSDLDRVAAYAEHIAGYIVKSNTHEEFMPLFAMLGFFFMLVTMP